MPAPDFQLDKDGMIAASPVTGWVTATAAGIAVFLGIQYAGSEEELISGQRRQVQLALTPQQCQELAATLTKLANRVLDSSGESQH